MAKKATPKTPLQKVKAELVEVEDQLIKANEVIRTLEKNLDNVREANKALSAKLEFEDEYEGLRTFLLDRLKYKRPEFVNSLFTNVKETINTRHMCKLSSLRDAAASAGKVLSEIEVESLKVNSQII